MPVCPPPLLSAPLPPAPALALQGGRWTQLTCDSLLIRKMPLPCDLDDGFMIQVVLGALRYSLGRSMVCVVTDRKPVSSANASYMQQLNVPCPLEASQVVSVTDVLL